MRAPRDFEEISRTPASSNTSRTAPPAINPAPAGAGLTKTLAAPCFPVISCAIVRLSIRFTLIKFLLADWIAFLTASGTSLALPIPTPTVPFLSPTTTVAEKRR